MPDAGALLAWAGTCLVHSSLLLAAAWLLDRGLPACLDRARELAWRTALLVPVGSATAQALLGGAAAGLPAPEVALAALLPAGAGRLAEGGGGSGGGIGALVLLALWGGVAGGSVLRLVVAHRRMRAQAGRGRRPTASEDRRLRQAIGMGAAPPACIRISPRLAMPTAFWNEIWLPERALRDLTVAELRAVLDHEAAHLARRDAFWRWTAALAQRVLFFQPLNRLAASRLRELSECLCDDAARDGGGRGVEMASALSVVSRWAGGGPSRCAAGLVGEESLTVRRVRRLLDGERIRPREVPLLLRAGAPALLSVLLCILGPGFGGAPPVVTVYATDPSGDFTLTMRRGRVLGATIAGTPVPGEHIRQDGAVVHLAEGSSQAFTVRVTHAGGIEWSPRLPPRSDP
ncbi:MAG TPA: M56 family metallopeptidase [Longimicrobium sp.]|nr:M56 family metallopeptidase [Longimicrobium sp.]